MNPPEVEEHEGVLVVRDDRVDGGTKVRAIPALLEAIGAAEEVVYASPASGYAQVALSIAAPLTGRRATIFTADRAAPHARTIEAIRHGAWIEMVSPGYMTVVAARARAYCAEKGATLLPFGLDHPAVLDAIADAARATGVEPDEVWAVAGSGTLIRSLTQAWPRARFHAVRVGAVPDVGDATLHTYPRPFEKPSRVAPPFPSVDNYDAKGWEMLTEQWGPAERDGVLFWNVAGAS